MACLLAMAALGLGGIGAGVALYLRSLHWELQAKRPPDARPPESPERADKIHRNGLELLEKAERFAWAAGDAESARESARRAEEDFERVLETYPKWPEALAATGRCRALRFDYAGACEAYEEALARGAEPRARFEAGWCWFLRHLVRASALSAPELAADPRAREAAAKAAGHLKRYAAEASESPRSCVAGAVAAALAGDASEAEPLLTHARFLDPTLPHAGLVEAWLLGRRGRPEEALQAAQELAARFRHLPEAHAVRAKAFAELGQTRNARGEWDALMRLWPTCAEGFLSLGRARAALAEPDAEAALMQAVELDESLKPYVK